MAIQMTKSQLIQKITEDGEFSKKDVKGVIETLVTIGYKELKRNGVFLLPGFCAGRHQGNTARRTMNGALRRTARKSYIIPRICIDLLARRTLPFLISRGSFGGRLCGH